MSASSDYQRLRAHLAFLSMTAAAEALPGLLDQAAKSFHSSAPVGPNRSGSTTCAWCRAASRWPREVPMASSLLVIRPMSSR